MVRHGAKQNENTIDSLGCTVLNKIPHCPNADGEADRGSTLIRSKYFD